jgi:hypothetical protein
MSLTEMVHKKMTGLNILTEMQFWLHLTAQKVWCIGARFTQVLYLAFF